MREKLSIRDALRNFVVGIFNYEKTGTWPDNGTLREWAVIGRDALNASPIAGDSEEMPKSDTPLTDAVWAELTETTDILKFAQTLEKRLNAERAAKARAEARVATTNDRRSGAVNTVAAQSEQNTQQIYWEQLHGMRQRAEHYLDNSIATKAEKKLARDVIALAAWVEAEGKALAQLDAEKCDTREIPVQIATLRYAALLCDSKNLSFKNAGYRSACEEIKICLLASIERLESGERMESTAGASAEKGKANE